MKFAQVLSVAAAGALLFSGSAQAQSNVAPSGVATQSSNWSGIVGLAPSAIDGNTSGTFNDWTVTATQGLAGDPVGNGYDWWQVELNQSFLVGSITIWNRTDPGTTDRLKDFTVSLFSGSTLEWSGVYSASDGPLPSTSFADINKTGDRVLVQLNRQTLLSLAEVQVFATPVPEPETQAMMLAGLGAVGILVRSRRSAWPADRVSRRP